MTARRTIGGKLTTAALEALAGPDPRMRHFQAMPREQQEHVIRRLALIGHTETYIAAATQLSVEQIRRVLDEGKAK